jgi:Caspase domain
MRIKIFQLIVLALGFVTVAKAQNLSSRSNEVLLPREIPTVKSDLPFIKWIKPSIEFSSSEQNKIEIEATVFSRSQLKDVRLVVLNSENSTPLSTKVIDFQKSNTPIEIKLSIFIPDGSHSISIEVTTLDKIIVTDKRSILIGKGASASVISLDRKDYALFFATDKYDHWDDLVNPIDDAQAIAKELSLNYGFQTEVIENPSTEDIWKKLREYNERKFGPQDQLLVFFAGHGHFDDTFGEGYVVAKNSLASDLSRNSYISHNRLRGVIGNISCNHILLTMDVCFGGTLDPVIAKHRGAKNTNELDKNEILVRKWSYRTRKYLTSGGKEYVSDGIPGKHSPFSEKLIESLRSRGGPDQMLTLGEIQLELEKLKQLPRVGSFGDDDPLSDFIFVAR